MPPSPDPWMDFARVVAGAFMGATFAFLFNFWLQWHVRCRQELAAGNLALIVLAQHLVDTHIVERGIRDHVAKTMAKVPDTPRWAQLWPQHFYFSDKLKFDYNSLAFLSLKGHRDVLARLAHSEQLYFDLAALVQAHSEATASIQERVSTNNLSALPWSEMEAKIGRHLTAKASMLTDGLVDRGERNPSDIRKAIQSLRGALVQQFGEKAVVKINEQPEIVRLK